MCWNAARKKLRFVRALLHSDCPHKKFISSTRKLHGCIGLKKGYDIFVQDLTYCVLQQQYRDAPTIRPSPLLYHCCFAALVSKLTRNLLLQICSSWQSRLAFRSSKSRFKNHHGRQTTQQSLKWGSQSSAFSITMPPSSVLISSLILGSAQGFVVQGEWYILPF